jgi:CHAD domain-containing protein
MRSAAKRGGITEMHEWRKRVKDLRYATEALAQSASQQERRRRKRLLAIAKAADTLGEALGEEHDLALLAQRVDAENEIFRRDKRGRRELRRAIGRRRKRLRKRAFERGKALYARTPKRFGRRLAKAR